MEFYSSDVLNVPSSSNPSNTLNCPSSSSQSIQLGLVNYHQHHHHHAIAHSFSETDPIMASAEGDPTSSITTSLFQTDQTSLQHRSHSSDGLLTEPNLPHVLGDGDDHGKNVSQETGTHHPSAQQCLLIEQQSHYQLNSSTEQQAQLSHLSSKVFNNPSPALHHELEFQYEEIHSCPLTSDSIPRSTQLDLDLSNSLLNTHQDPTTSAAATAITSLELSCSAHGNVMGLGSCFVDCSGLGNLPFQSSVDQALMGFESSFNFQEHRPSDHEMDEEQSNCTPITELSPFSSHHRHQANQEHQIHFQPHQHAGWQSFRSTSSSFEDDQNQLPLSPTEMAAMRSSPPCITHSSDLYFNSSPLYRYNQAGSIPPYAESVSLPSYTEPTSMPTYSEPPLAMVLSQSPPVLRNDSTASEFSNASSLNSNGVNPIHVNPLSQPMTPPDDIFAPMNDPFHQSWWGNPNHHSNVESLVSSARASLDPCVQNSTEPEVGVRISSIFSQPLRLSSSSPTAQASSRDPSSPYNIPTQTKPPPSPSFHLPHKTRRTSHRSNLSNHQRNTASKITTRPFLIEPDYSRLPTKRSRGRRPPISPDLGLPIPDGHLSIGLQSVPGGQAFDPNLNPNAETVKYCELTKTGKPKKIFICQVKGCGKCFKRSEHLKRHVRSIHTNDKPYNCPWMACMKSFSRHDNLNQHLRVHRVEEGGEVLNGLHIGSDGILRSDLDESPVDPIIRGLRNVEVMDRFTIEE